MARKIFDIIPPKKIEALRDREFRPSIFLPKISLFKKRIFIFLIFFLILFFLVVLILPGKAKIEIWPKMEVLSLKSELKVDSQIKEVNSQAISGKIIEVEELLSQQFLASGKTLKEGKAQGIIRVYNSYSSAPQTLIATTRFVSAEGKLFRTPKRVVIPGKQVLGGKSVPGEIDIEVVADQAGPEYNIGPSTFSIPGFAGTPRYTGFYGKSFKSMTGGFKKEVSFVTKEDLKLASKILEEKAIEKAKNSLKEKIPEDFILLEGAVVSEILELSSLAEAGQEIESFLVKAKAKAKALVFKKSELKEWALNFIRSEISEKKEVKEDSLDLEYSIKNINLEKGKLDLLLEFSAQIFLKINTDTLKETIKGKKEDEVKKEVLGNFPAISKTKVKLSPFWLRRLPKDPASLEIELKI